MPEPQAKAMAEAFRDAQGEADWVTKKDLQIELAPIKSDISLIKWMLGLLEVSRRSSSRRFSKPDDGHRAILRPMATLTFDTHAAVKKLIAAGMPDEQAEAQVEILSEVLSANLGELATKQDLKELEMRLDARFEALRGELDARFEALKGEQTLLKWMLGLLLGGVVALVLKAFFPV